MFLSCSFCLSFCLLCLAGGFCQILCINFNNIWEIVWVDCGIDFANNYFAVNLSSKFAIKSPSRILPHLENDATYLEKCLSGAIYCVTVCIYYVCCAEMTGDCVCRCLTRWWSRTTRLCLSISWSKTPMRLTVSTTRLSMTSASALSNWPRPPTATWTTSSQRPCLASPRAFDSLDRFCRLWMSEYCVTVSTGLLTFWRSNVSQSVCKETMSI